MPELLFVLLGHDQSGCYWLFAELILLWWGFIAVVVVAIVIVIVVVFVA